MQLSSIGSTPALTPAVLRALTTALQAVHLVERMAQVIQEFVFDIASAHGLIGQLDMEQVHFAFNLRYLGLLIYAALGWLNFARPYEELSLRSSQPG